MSEIWDSESGEQDGEAVVTYSVPGKRRSRDVSVSVNQLLGIGRPLTFSRALRVDFPGPIMMATVGLGKDHCVYLLVEEDALDKLQKEAPMAEDIFNPITAYERAREDRYGLARLAILEHFHYLSSVLDGFYEVNDEALKLLKGEAEVAHAVLLQELEALRDDS